MACGHIANTAVKREWNKILWEFMPNCTRNWGQMHQYNVEALFKRTAIDIAEPSPRSNLGNRYLMMTTDYFTMMPEAYAITNQEARWKHWFPTSAAASVGVGVTQ
jgi:hypothetical protein